MTQPLARTTLRQQLANALREGIECGRWSHEMPSESELCREYQVSRMTMRKAVAQLVEDGWIEAGGRGRRHRIRKAPSKPAAPVGRIIRILTPFSIGEWSTTNYAILDALHTRLTKSGFQLEIERHRGLFKNFHVTKIERINSLPDTAGWVCCYGTEEIHRWFARSNLPVVVLGRVHGDLRLSAVYPDMVAAARHAVVKLLQAGHRRLVYLIADPTSLNDRLASREFLHEAGRMGAHARVAVHDGTAVSVGKLMTRLLATKPSPTGFAVGSSEAAITVLCRLLDAGIRLPADAAVVSMWDDTNLDATHPTIARYRSNGTRIGQLLAKCILDQILHGHGSVHSQAIMPDYIPGGSLGRGGR